MKIINELKFEEREINNLKKLKDPNVLEYIDSFSENEEIYIITEYCQKGNLMEYLEN